MAHRTEGAVATILCPIKIGRLFKTGNSCFFLCPCKGRFLARSAFSLWLSICSIRTASSLPCFLCNARCFSPIQMCNGWKPPLTLSRPRNIPWAEHGLVPPIGAPPVQKHFSPCLSNGLYENGRHCCGRVFDCRTST